MSKSKEIEGNKSFPESDTIDQVLVNLGKAIENLHKEVEVLHSRISSLELSIPRDV